MSFKHGDMAIQELGSRQYKDRDDEDMAKFGRKQRFERNFGFLSMLGFTTTMMCTWEAVLTANPAAMTDGGPATLVYGFIFCWIGALLTAASLAEMASMAPTSAGQYHWVSILAPKGQAVFLSWVTGWLDMIGWWANTASGVYFAATVLQGLLVLNYDGYDFQRWHGTLLMFAALVICLLVNSFGARLLPKIEGLILILHTAGFLAILIPLVYLAPHKNAEFVFANFTNTSGWKNSGLTWLIGLMGTNLPFIGYDGPCHMSEEVVNASVIVPWCMIATIMLNGVLGFAMVLAFLFCVGDLDAALDSATGYDFIEVFFNATKSHAGTSVMSAIVIALTICASFGFLASSSRLTWALAKDKGIPFADFLSHINTRTSGSALPLRAIALCAIITAITCLINIGSSAAFNAMISLTTAGLFSSYEIAIVLILIKKLKNEPLQYGPWKMGRLWGILINIGSICFLTITIFFSFFPEELPVTPTNMNWSIVVFMGEFLLGLGWYLVRGRKIYHGPVMDMPVAVGESAVVGGDGVDEE
ncbi:amino acid permease [Aspergillus vadensis CBS 113365]|uniref:Amino acid permease n=1 Tax=Aspergillus vadensis (strain CBS 113365 / IMI 142717 / IBT 24658) TaxID=1448311 RepID=A0A319AYW9_ASPVC|nr:amino acid permease [Aspergillus vadensis CBS 113365]PYH65005.1 amino acid permease [Aspergillus vadensis CBS 113365]